jgi:beta-lactamase class A
MAAVSAPLVAKSLNHSQLRTEFERIVRGADGRVGVCARDAAATTYVNGNLRFSLQSVMKLLVGLAVMDAVDRRGWRLDEEVLVHKKDLSVFVQPIAKPLLISIGATLVQHSAQRRA